MADTPSAASEAGVQLNVAAHRARWTAERVLAIRYWTDALLTLRITRPPGFRFKPGLYARLGLARRDDPNAPAVFRPFSMISATDAAELEFVAVLVPQGPFSERLAQLRVGDEILLERASFGFLTTDAFAGGGDLWLLATGTGIGPFLSMLRDPSVWHRFSRLIVVHSVRERAELLFQNDFATLAAAHAGHADTAELTYLPIVTREPMPGALNRRIPTLLEDGTLEAAAGRTLDPEQSRVMACGNPQMAADVRRLLSGRGFAPARRHSPGQMAFEQYWAE